MNKAIRFLIVFIVVVVMFALTWRKDSQGVLVGDSVSTFNLVIATPSPVALNTRDIPKAASMHNLVLVEFFAGY